MNKDIWHTADIKPKSLKTFVYETDKGHIGTSMLTIDSGWNPVLLPEFYSMDDFEVAERITKWCYLDDIITALEQSETCCSEWEKQALDYKAELIKTEQMLGDVFNALDPVSQEYFRATFSDQIKQITESPTENVQSDTKSRPVNVQK